MTRPIEIDHANKTITLSQNTSITLSVAFLLMIGGSLITATAWVETIGSRVDNLESRSVSQAEAIQALQTETVDAKLKYTEIQTQLRNIDASLLDIKQTLRGN